MHGYRGLVVFGSREGLRCLGRNRCILIDQLGHHAAQGFDTQRQWSHVQQQHILDVATEYTTLNGGTTGYGFVRVDVATRFLAEEIFNNFLNLGHTGLSTDQDDVVDVRYR